MGHSKGDRVVAFMTAQETTKEQGLSVPTIASGSGVSASSVYRHLQTLMDTGVVGRVNYDPKRKESANEYYLDFARLSAVMAETEKLPQASKNADKLIEAADDALNVKSRLDFMSQQLDMLLGSIHGKIEAGPNSFEFTEDELQAAQADAKVFIEEEFTVVNILAGYVNKIKEDPSALKTTRGIALRLWLVDGKVKAHTPREDNNS